MSKPAGRGRRRARASAARTTRVLPVHPRRPAAEPIAEAAAILRAGGLVAFPTETVYGLGASALDAAAVQRIYAAKGRPAHNPVIVHVADAAAARKLVTRWPAAAAQLARRFWPGPLTLVLPRRELVPDAVTAGGDTVGIRVPAHPVALALMRAAGVPIAAPSANRANRVSPTRGEHVLRELGGRIDLLLDGGATLRGLESTVVDLTVWPPRILRPGPITTAALRRVIGAVEPGGGGPRPRVLRAPGNLPRHYAPRVPLECSQDARGRVAALARRQRVGCLIFGGAGSAAAAAGERLVQVRMPRSPAAYARRLYAALHELEAAGVARIVVEWPPEGPAWVAIRDRLSRAMRRGAQAAAKTGAARGRGRRRSSSGR